MKTNRIARSLFSSPAAILLLSSAMGVPVIAQQAQPTSGDSHTTAQPTAQPPASQPLSYTVTRKEGFWGKMNPLARKRWVKRQTVAISDQLSELDEVNAKNTRDIRDVDGRAQAGIHKAQSAADAANQMASAANTQAGFASSSALNASGHVDSLHNTVNGLDQYRQVSEADVVFHSGQSTLSTIARKHLDDLAATVVGQQGYILEIEAHSPAAGGVGIQSSERLGEEVERYLITQHNIPVYRMHAVSLGNAHGTGTDADSKPVHISSVHVRLMENSLAAQGPVTPPSAISLRGTEQRP